MRLKQFLSGPCGLGWEEVQLFLECLAARSYSREFTKRLLDVAFDGNSRWRFRCVVIGFLQHQVLMLEESDHEEYAYLFDQLSLLDPQSNERTLKAAVLKEGYTTREFCGFVTEFRRRLERHRFVFQGLRGLNTTQTAVTSVMHFASSECHLALARHIFAAREVVPRLHEDMRASRGIPSPFPEADGFIDEEVERMLTALPAYEAEIVRELNESSEVYWVSDHTSERINALVEYPLTTVVLVVKPPGSSLEIELKRAGHKGRRAPIGVRYLNSNGRTVPASHRLDGASRGWSLHFDARASALFSRIYRIVAGEEAKVPLITSIKSIYEVPVEEEMYHMIDFYSSPEVFDEDFEGIQESMQKAAKAFTKELGSEVPSMPGPMGDIAQFIHQTTPSVAVVLGTTAFRLDKLACYLSEEGPKVYFKKGLGVQPSKPEARRFADDLLLEILGVVDFGDLRYDSHANYIERVLHGNRKRADEMYLKSLKAAGEIWGAFFALGSHSHGEAFVPRNVGLRSVWKAGEWTVEIVFMDHDDTYVPGKRIKNYKPRAIVSSLKAESRYVVHERVCSLSKSNIQEHLGLIYGVGRKVRKEGAGLIRKSIQTSYRRTLKAAKKDPLMRECYHESYLAQLLVWDRCATLFLRAKKEGSNAKAAIEPVVRYLKRKKFSKEMIAEYSGALRHNSRFLNHFSDVFLGR
ncbi:MAG: hypothetical protein ACI8QF_002853 [Limisphaerales bacterium]